MARQTNRQTAAERDNSNNAHHARLHELARLFEHLEMERGKRLHESNQLSVEGYEFCMDGT
eukprot:2304694-Amphidinium_carterae.1